MSKETKQSNYNNHPPIRADEYAKEHPFMYDRIFAIKDDNSAIVKLIGHGYTALRGKKRYDDQFIVVTDFAASHLKFDYGEYKKIHDDSEVEQEIIDNIKYTLEHAAGYYGIIHPGLEIEGIE